MLSILGKRVGISLDMAPVHWGGRVKAYIDRRTAEGRLVVEEIEGGLTSVLQVCDLVANKEIKHIIKTLYLKYRTEFIMAEQAKTPGEPNRRIMMKIPIVKMMEIIEKAVKQFNDRQRETKSVKKEFVNAGQDPWKDCKQRFKAHLNSLSKLPLYGGCKTTSDIIEDRNLKGRTSLKVPDFDLEQEEEEVMVVAEEIDLGLEEEWSWKWL